MGDAYANPKTAMPKVVDQLDPRPVEQFPGVRIAEAEWFALLVAQKAIVPYHGTPFEKPLKTACRKLTAQLSPDSEYTFHNLQQALSSRPLGPEDTDLELYLDLSQRTESASRRVESGWPAKARLPGRFMIQSFQ